jgi:hypothetical protein
MGRFDRSAACSPWTGPNPNHVLESHVPVNAYLLCSPAGPVPFEHYAIFFAQNVSTNPERGMVSSARKPTRFNE